MALGVVGVALALVRGRAVTWALPLFSLPLLLTFFHLFFHAKDRFHMPLDGIIAIFAAMTLVEAAQLVLRPRRRLLSETIPAEAVASSGS
jgi:hypothetical protein